MWRTISLLSLLLPTRFLSAEVALIELHGPQGQIIYVNPHEVTSIREPRDVIQRQGHFAPGTHCILVMTHGSFIAVTDPCAEVRRLMEGR